MISFTRLKSIVPFTLLSALLVLTGAGCGSDNSAQLAASTPVKLVVWRVFDDDASFTAMMNAYREIHKNVSFTYKTLRYDEYEDELLRAFAEGTGPDIFSIPNTWIGKYESLIQPLPTSLSIPYSEERGTLKKETIVTLKEEPTISLRELKASFVDVVAEDVVREYQPNPKLEAEERIYALPLSVDTLALYYNKDLFNTAGIAEPPKNWVDFQSDVEKLSTIGANDAVIQSGAAIGGSKNIERASDIVSLLMLQNGTKMTDDRGSATFANQLDDDSLPGAKAVSFYAEFGSPVKSVYTWNKTMPTSFDAFTSGKTAMFFGYSYHDALIKARSPKLSYGITSVPQITNGRTVNFANYWVETVAKASKNVTWAWDFVQFASEEAQVKSYLDATKKPTALRSLMSTQVEDETLSPFIGQLLTSQSWYKGKDVAAAEQALLDLIDSALNGADLEKVIRDAQNKVNQTL